MKKWLFIFSALILITSCKKDTQLETPLSKEIAMSKDRDFILLMDATKRFDPLYVELIFKENLTSKFVNNENFFNLNEQTTEEAFVSNLVSKYHFKSKEELLNHSTTIQHGLTKIFNTYLAGLTTKEQAGIFFKARKLYAKNKLSKSSDLGGNGNIRFMSFDMPIAEDDYYRVISEETEVDDFYGNDHAIDCKDECCINKKICINNAYIKLLESLKYIAAYAVAGGGFAFQVGSFFGGPQAGVVGAILGGVYGGASAAAVIYLTYHTEKNNCGLTYNNCMLKK